MILLLKGTVLLGTLVYHHSSSDVLTRCQLSGAMVSQCLRGRCLFSSAARLLYGLCRSLTRLPLQRSIWRSTARTRRATEKELLLELAWCCRKARALWEKCLQGDSDPLFCSAYEELDYISADNIPDLTGVLDRLCCQIGQWWNSPFSQNHPVASE